MVDSKSTSIAHTERLPKNWMMETKKRQISDINNTHFLQAWSNSTTAAPTDHHGNLLPPYAPPAQPLVSPPLAHTSEAWSPFENHVEFDFANYHFIHCQSSEAEINIELDMWRAKILTAGGDPDTVPWERCQHLYQTINAIDNINVQWTTMEVKYTGVRPPTPPAWMTKTYKLKEWDQLFKKVPYWQFNAQRRQVHSSFMSADWAWEQVDKIVQDPNTHGCMFIPFISGSDKTTVSVATGHQEYHPVYASPGNLTNVAQCTHPFALVPMAFLAIPKSMR
ncbi:hypothetical protein VKT23_008205 [Stygiomarasmius scandens]|uniref:Uncharacterized protein n=1 Tax=Marasmiellus scandens TaxID=2682957 RepID=A0ABR1JHK6_9AGAR